MDYTVNMYPGTELHSLGQEPPLEIVLALGKIKINFSTTKNYNIYPNKFPSKNDRNEMNQRCFEKFYFLIVKTLAE